MTKNVQEQLVDWHKVWKHTMETCSLVAVESGTLKQWSVNEAEQFLRDSDGQYVKQMLEKIKVTKDDDVIDIGCGPGRLTIPLAKIANSVTAVDLSTGMLDVLKQRAKKEGINNITCVNKYWREIIVGKDIKTEYDVSIASNSINLLGSKEIQKNNKTQLDWNLKDALHKIDSVGKSNYITMPVLHHKGFSEIFVVLDKKYQPFPNYIVVHNVLHQLTINPEIEYFWTQCKKHNKPEKVLKRIEWLSNIKPEQRKLLKDKIESSLDKSDNSRQVWALIQWHQK